MEENNSLRPRVIWIIFCVALLIAGGAVAVLPAEISDTTKLLLLGGVLLTVGIWGRRRLKRG
jgi:hypothetical protein